jgi:4-hydroxybenzoate polyprenyltransferase
MILASNVLPDHAGYVVAAYLVFLALLLIYVGIMAYKLARVEREVVALNDLADRDADRAEPPAAREETHA